MLKNMEMFQDRKVKLLSSSYCIKYTELTILRIKVQSFLFEHVFDSFYINRGNHRTGRPCKGSWTMPHGYTNNFLKTCEIISISKFI